MECYAARMESLQAHTSSKGQHTYFTPNASDGDIRGQETPRPHAMLISILADSSNCCTGREVNWLLRQRLTKTSCNKTQCFGREWTKKRDKTVLGQGFVKVS